MNNKPVAWKVWNRMGGITFQLRKPSDSEYVEYEPLYTHPVKELTDEEIIQINKEEGTCWDVPDRFAIQLARAILRKAQEK